jgi:hypothetical protein
VSASQSDCVCKMQLVKPKLSSHMQPSPSSLDAIPLMFGPTKCDESTLSHAYTSALRTYTGSACRTEALLR